MQIEIDPVASGVEADLLLLVQSKDARILLKHSDAAFRLTCAVIGNGVGELHVYL